MNTCINCELARKIAQDYADLNKQMVENNQKLSRSLREIKRHLRDIKRSFMSMMDVEVDSEP